MSRANYWRWLFRGTRGRPPAILSFVDIWLPIHLAVGSGLAWLVKKPLDGAASGVLLPLTGVLVGLTFAWAANAQTVLQTDEILRVARRSSGDIEGYVFKYLTSILVMLTAIVAWGLAGLGLFERPWNVPLQAIGYKLIEGGIYALTSIAVRACWQVVMVTQTLLVGRLMVQDSDRALKEREEQALRRA